VLIDYSNLGASVSSKIRSSSSVNEIPPTGLSGIGSDYNVQKPHKLAHFQTVKRYYDKYIIKAGYRKLKSLRHHPRRTPNLTFGLELENDYPWVSRRRRIQSCSYRLEANYIELELSDMML
jgi:hypothetical protein